MVSIIINPAKGAAMNIKLKTMFIEKKKTQREVALSLGMPETRISEFVQEVRVADMEMQKAIALKLGCEVGDIF